MTNLSLYEDTNEKKWLNNVKNETDKMNSLIKNMLDLASSENNMKFELINLSKLVEGTVLSFESMFFENKIKYEYYINENIFYKCNGEQIKQVVGILIDNAIKHSDKKGNIIISLLESKNNIILKVSNKGEAIKKGDEEKIFERFYRADKSRNRKDNRYGLGLSIARKIINLHNSSIVAFSKDGYTTFKIEFNK